VPGSVQSSRTACGQSGAAAASRARNTRLAFSSYRALPRVKDRRNDPSVDGARAPRNKSAMAPSRSTSMSPMLSALAAIPATRQPAFRSALTPAPPAAWTCWRTRATWPAHQRDRPGPRHEIPVIKRRLHPRRAMEQSHLTGAP
jgi:hypothetical protein